MTSKGERIVATKQHVVFRIGKEEYGFDIMKVHVIERYQEVMEVPNVPQYIEGVINLRGEVLPIYNLRAKFNLPDRAPDNATKIIVAYSNGMKVGIVVDAVVEILHIDESQIEEMPKLITGIDRRYIRSVSKVDKRMIVLVDLDLLVSDEEKLSLGEILENGE